MTPGSSPRSSKHDRHDPSANTGSRTDDNDDDDLDWPELKSRDDVGSKWDKPIVWSRELKNDEEVYLDNLRRSCESQPMMTRTSVGQDTDWNNRLSHTPGLV
jgi:hypothetical protein